MLLLLHSSHLSPCLAPLPAGCCQRASIIKVPETFSKGLKLLSLWHTFWSHHRLTEKPVKSNRKGQIPMLTQSYKPRLTEIFSREKLSNSKSWIFSAKSQYLVWFGKLTEQFSREKLSDSKSWIFTSNHNGRFDFE